MSSPYMFHVNSWITHHHVSIRFLHCHKRRICIPTRMEVTTPSSSTSENSRKKKVVVCGGGVIGACTAFFLSRKGADVTVVERCEVACAASGKAGGFLALDWCDSGALWSLARASFRLHENLSEELGGREAYGYRRLDTFSVSISEQLVTGGRIKSKNLPSWVDSLGAGSSASIGSTKTTAQVHPGLFTKTLVSVATSQYDAKVVIGTAEKLEFNEDGITIQGVWVDGKLISADAVVLAMGPWTSKNEIVASLCLIYGLKAHSIVLRPEFPESIGPQALFLNYKTEEGNTIEPEVYPRPTGEVYVCGMSEEVDLPDSPEQVVPRKEAMEMLQRVAKTVSSSLETAVLQAEQACFLPCSEDGKPVIGKIPDVNGLYVATGHSCWGILNGPATGASMAELILDGNAKVVDLKSFDPARFKKSWRV